MTSVRIVLSALCAFGLVSLAHARDEGKHHSDPAHHVTYQVRDWRALVPELAVEFKDYRQVVLANSTYSDDEKIARIKAKFRDIAERVRKQRIATYEAVSPLVGVGNSCTNQGSSPKNCKAKCAAASLPDMVVRPEAVRGAYRSGSMHAGAGVLSGGHAVSAAAIVVNGGTTVCAIKLKQSGHGRKVSYSEARFRIRPDRLARIVDEEVTAVMRDVTG